MLRSALRVAAEWHRRLTARQDASGRKGEDAARQQRAHLHRSAGITQTVRTEVLQRFMNNPGKNALTLHNGSQACPQTKKTRGNASQPEKQLVAYHGRLSRSEFHEGQVPLKASGSCSWCWYSSRHIQRVENILSAHHKDQTVRPCAALTSGQGRPPVLVAHASRKAHHHRQQPAFTMPVLRTAIELQAATRQPEARVHWHHAQVTRNAWQCSQHGRPTTKSASPPADPAPSFKTPALARASASTLCAPRRTVPPAPTVHA